MLLCRRRRQHAARQFGRVCTLYALSGGVLLVVLTGIKHSDKEILGQDNEKLRNHTSNFRKTPDKWLPMS